MIIDITKPALSKEALSDYKDSLRGSIERIESKTTVMIRSMILLYIAGCLGIGFAYDLSEKYSDSFVFWLWFISTFVAVSGFAFPTNRKLFKGNGVITLLMALLATLIMLPIVVQEQGSHSKLWGFVATHMFGTALVSVILKIIVWKVCGQKEIFENNLNSYSYAPSESCLSIVKWLDNCEIRQFRDSVVSQNRLFTNAEVKAMRDYHNNEPQSKALKDAYEKVYMQSSVI